MKSLVPVFLLAALALGYFAYKSTSDTDTTAVTDASLSQPAAEETVEPTSAAADADPALPTATAPSVATDKSNTSANVTTAAVADTAAAATEDKNVVATEETPAATQENQSAAVNESPTTSAEAVATNATPAAEPSTTNTATANGNAKAVDDVALPENPETATGTKEEKVTEETTATREAVEHSVNAIGVKFSPIFIYVEPGDIVNWNGMAGHNIETLDTMTPEGQEKINTELGSNVTSVFSKEGIVVYKCTPHWGARMGGIIVVGKPENSGAIIQQYLDSLKTDRSNLPAKGLLKKLKKDMEAKGWSL